ncbi:thioredoxin family protein [bacterium]|nr:thioredoxin family protein [bacterium]
MSEVRHTGQINVELIVRPECGYCERINQELYQINDQTPEMSLDIRNIADMEGVKRPMGGITPSIWVNGQLWFLGSFNDETFRNRLKALRNTNSPIISK